MHIYKERTKNSTTSFRHWISLILGLTLSVSSYGDGEFNDQWVCKADLSKPGQMRDVLANVLTRFYNFHEDNVRSFLDTAVEDAASGETLTMATASNFGTSVQRLNAEVARFESLNCTDSADNTTYENTFNLVTYYPAWEFAKNVTLHVAIHELGHALIREFDIPVLGNEETAADGFATYYIATYMPNIAPEVLQARVQSHMYEALQEPREHWSFSGEHNHDARRAYQIVAMAIAVDRDKYQFLAEHVGMSDRQIRSSADYGSEIVRSWRRTLQPLMMPEGMLTNETRFDCQCGTGPFKKLTDMGLFDLLKPVFRGFDWHSQVTLIFAIGDGGASWNRSGRTVIIKSGYVERLYQQGQAMAD